MCARAAQKKIVVNGSVYIGCIILVLKFVCAPPSLLLKKYFAPPSSMLRKALAPPGNRPEVNYLFSASSLTQQFS